MSQTKQRPQQFWDENAAPVNVNGLDADGYSNTAIIADGSVVSNAIESLVEEEVKRQLQQANDLKNYGPPPAPPQMNVYRHAPGQNPVLLGQVAVIDFNIEQQVEYEMSGTIAHQELQETQDNLQLAMGISRQLISMIERELEFEMQRRPSLKRYFESRKQALNILDDVVNPENENPQADEDTGDQIPEDDEIPF